MSHYVRLDSLATKLSLAAVTRETAVDHGESVRQDMTGVIVDLARRAAVKSVE